MWTKARCLAAFEGRLPAAYTVDVAFKLPVLLPAKVGFAAHAKARRLAVRAVRRPQRQAAPDRRGHGITVPPASARVIAGMSEYGD